MGLLGELVLLLWQIITALTRTVTCGSTSKVHRNVEHFVLHPHVIISRHAFGTGGRAIHSGMRLSPSIPL